ncbi:MAG: type II toxin-antitoxin system RelE/ParE family toxin [Bacteroidales bacterium]|nr:type II toxin-antitoxin system RelE/ParE family toxin [Bacteroidales bacterium]
MKTYKIEISESALSDINDLAFVIHDLYKAPITAKKYVKGLYKEIKKLESIGETLPLQTRKSLTQYGQNVRRLNYKKMAIIYTIHQDVILLHRVIPSNTIAGL